MKVIIVFDHYTDWEKLVDHVVKKAYPIDTFLKALAIVEPLNHAHAEWPNETLDRFIDKRYKAAEQLLKNVNAGLGKLRDVHVHTEIRHGDVLPVIIDTAAEWMADEVTIGIRGRGDIKNTLALAHGSCTIDFVHLHESTKRVKKNAQPV